MLRPWHRIQVGVYLLLIEDTQGVKPPHGVVVLGNGSRHRIANTTELRAEVMELANRLRVAKASIDVPIPVLPVPGQCRPCGMRGVCDQTKM